MDKKHLSGICEACQAARDFIAVRLEVPSGGALLGLHCPHNQVNAIGRVHADGSCGKWRLEAPAAEGQLIPRMAFIAGIADEVALQRSVTGTAEAIERASVKALPSPEALH